MVRDAFSTFLELYAKRYNSNSARGKFYRNLRIAWTPLVGSTVVSVFFVRFLLELNVLRGLRLRWKNVISSMDVVVTVCYSSLRRPFFFFFLELTILRDLRKNVGKRHLVEGRSEARTVRCVL